MENGITIKIDKLGPVQGPYTLPIHPFMIFSGASGVGKSYLAMLVHYVYRVLCGAEINVYFAQQEVSLEKLKASMSIEGGEIYRLDMDHFMAWVNENAKVYLQNLLENPELEAQFEIVLPDLPQHLVFMYDRMEMKSNANNDSVYLETLRLSGSGAGLRLPMNEYSSWGVFPFGYVLSEYFRYRYHYLLTNTFFMPPSRGSLVAVPDDLVFSLRQSMGLYTEFLADLSLLKSLAPQNNLSATLASAIRLLHDEVLHGDIHVKENKLNYSYSSTQPPIPITAAASSIKELAPLALMYNKGLLGKYSILFEEPESHLHPKLQLRVADLLAFGLKEGAHFQITTHSDYLLRRINDLIRLHVLKEKLNDAVAYEQACEELGMNPDLTIDPQQVGAFYVQDAGDDGSRVVEQSIEHGIPFDSFQQVLEEELNRSADLYDRVEYFTQYE